MSSKNFMRLCLLLCILIIPLVACDVLPPVTGNGTPVTSPANGSQLNVWSRVAPGVEVRYEDWKNPGGDDDTVTIVRFDLHKVKLSVGYQPQQPLMMSQWMQQEQATQSSPMLMLAGKRTQFSADASQTRRSVVATDKQGRLLFIASPGQVFSLDQLADQLAASDLSIDTALNLDGGASTGLYVNAGSQHINIDSVTSLPIVIVAKAK